MAGHSSQHALIADRHHFSTHKEMGNPPARSPTAVLKTTPTGRSTVQTRERRRVRWRPAMGPILPAVCQPGAKSACPNSFHRDAGDERSRAAGSLASPCRRRRCPPPRRGFPTAVFRRRRVLLGQVSDGHGTGKQRRAFVNRERAMALGNASAVRAARRQWGAAFAPAAIGDMAGLGRGDREGVDG